VALAMLVAAACGTVAQAQTPKAGAKAQTKAATQPAQQPGATEQPGGTPVQELVWSPWTKFCDRASDTSSRGACFTSQYGQRDTGATVVVATVIEAEGRKALRVTVPLAMQLAQGMRAVIDQGQPMNAPYRVCATSGCEAEFEASDELIEKLKTGQRLTVQCINFQGYEVSFSMPLLGFAKAHDGAPTDLQAARRLQEDLQKRAEEARKRLEVPPPEKK
jgi:invasion protein IalB